MQGRAGSRGYPWNVARARVWLARARLRQQTSRTHSETVVSSARGEPFVRLRRLALDLVADIYALAARSDPSACSMERAVVGGSTSIKQAERS